ncbi:hypothetical protein HanRHA438_Chr02g0057301 [Helianthus annuus]|nr:hypothetical protein HanRHA438_Chr02g0057301 [Helianthus annuus]
MIRGKNISLLIDSHLEGNFSTEEATVVFDLASRCLHNEPMGKTEYERLVATLAPLQTKPDVSPHFRSCGLRILMRFHFLYNGFSVVWACRVGSLTHLHNNGIFMLVWCRAEVNVAVAWIACHLLRAVNLLF